MTFEIAKYFGDFQNAGTHDSEWEVLRSRDLIFEYREYPGDEVG